MDGRGSSSYFLAVVEHRGFSQAADELHIAQPSLSQAMANLERELGVPLFHRVGRGIVLVRCRRAARGAGPPGAAGPGAGQGRRASPVGCNAAGSSWSPCPARHRAADHHHPLTSPTRTRR